MRSLSWGYKWWLLPLQSHPLPGNCPLQTSSDLIQVDGDVEILETMLENMENMDSMEKIYGENIWRRYMEKIWGRVGNHPGFTLSGTFLGAAILNTLQCHQTWRQLRLEKSSSPWRFYGTIIPIGSMVLLYMVTFTINLPPMLAYIPYMDPMGYGIYIC